ncbi:MAG: TetR/AcrR family transcriptional regulator [Caulobacteraceae bacterium]|nr:TetR/AcrR family transcriptional regulator [Caulobacteraceae bacterium]
MTITLNKPPKSARKAKGDGHLRRAEILQAAERIFLRDGYQGATIRKIADEVGVSSTALYMHFRDKDEILLEICEGAISALLAQNTEIAGRPIDSVSRVRLMLDAYMRFGLDNPNTYWLTFCSSPDEISPGKRTAASELGARCYERFKGTIADVAKEGRLRSGVDIAAQVLWGACHGVVTLRIGRPNVDWAADDELITVLLDSLFQGQVVD